MDIYNILYLIRNNLFLTNKLIGILDYSINKIKPIEPYIDISYNDKQICNNDKIKYLESIAPGRNSFSIYQTFCVDTLKYLFSNVLDLWERQKLTNDGLNKYDLICKIKSNNGNEFF